MKIRPDFSVEFKYWEMGFVYVIGADEVGRGSLAGPVVAGAAVLKYVADKKSLNTIYKLGINDSKKLSSQQRDKLAKKIPEYFYYSIGEASVSEINKMGIVNATEKAMRRAVTNIKNQISKIKKKDNEIKSFLLLDGFRVKYIPGFGLKHQEAIIKGDGKSITIAAASILAKVYRDNLMRKMSGEFPVYLWEKNKGYGTKRHILSISTIGISRHHREKFVDGLINPNV